MPLPFNLKTLLKLSTHIQFSKNKSKSEILIKANCLDFSLKLPQGEIKAIRKYEFRLRNLLVEVNGIEPMTFPLTKRDALSLRFPIYSFQTTNWWR